MKDKHIVRTYYKVVHLLWEISRSSIVLIMLLTILTAFVPVFSTIIMQKIINLLQNPLRKIEWLLLLVIIYIMCDILTSAVAIILNYITVLFEHRLTLIIDMKMLNKIANLGLQDFETSESYNKLQRAQTQSGIQLFNYFMHIIAIIKFIVLIVGYSAILFSWKNWPTLLVSFIAFINAKLLLDVGKYQYKMLRSRTSKARERWYYQHILTNDVYFKEIKTYGLHKFFADKFEKIAVSFLQQDKVIAQKNIFIGSVRVVLEQIGNVLILGCVFIDTFYNRILIGDTITYIRCISNLKSNINNLFTQIVGIYKETLYINQLFEFLEMPIFESNAANKIKIDKINSITISGLNYKYKDTDHYILKNINLIIKATDNYIIVGKNGSGKSTLVKILAGFYDDYEGDIFINDFNFREIDKDSYRNRIGILFQDYNKYEMKIRENVGVGNLNVLNDDLKIKDALIYANAPSKIYDNLDKQLGYWFDEGRQLSGGEWLRIAISRIFIREAEFYILDEPDAALDPISKDNIIKRLSELVCDKMGIIITHRIASIGKLPGMIIVMDDGKILDQGSHEQLIDRCVVYEEMYRKATE